MKHFSFLAITLAILSGCNDSGGAALNPASLTNGGAVIPSAASPLNPPAAAGPAAPSAPSAPRSYSTDALLFVGSGTWAPEVSALKDILTANGASFDSVSSAQLDAMAVDDIAKYGILIFPGGSGGTEAGSLSEQTHANLREAVQKRGVSYIGFCAGAFIAQAPAPAPGQDVSYGLGIVDGPELEYYYLEHQGTSVAMTLHTFADGSTDDILWYGGPITPNTPGGVIAKYPDGNPAITELWSGNGFVILAGGHPSATQSMMSSLGVSSSDGVHADLTWKLIHAALHQQPLPAF